MRGKFFSLVVLVCSLYSCIKPPQYAAPPQIQFVSVSASQVYDYVNDTITFSFTDGNGQVGVSSSATNPDSLLCGLQKGDSAELYFPSVNVFLVDSRTNCITAYASGTASSSSKYKGISGNIIVVQNIFSQKCIQPSTTCPLDTVVYSIMIRDAAGSLSNIVQTTPIIINGTQY